MSQPSVAQPQAAPADEPISEFHRTLASIERERGPHRINRVINHPSVYPMVRGYAIGRLDLQPLVAKPENILLMGEHGGVMFVHHQGGLYETHTQVVPEGRGRWTFDMVRAALHWMFTRTDALEIVTRVPRGNLAALALVRAIGGVEEFTNPRGWIKDGDPIPAKMFALRVQDWMRTAPGLVERGRWFHTRLDQEYARLNVKHAQHADDETHDRHVGMACEMMMGGQPHKAAVFYNRCAVMADYAPISIVGLSPLTVDIRDAIICIRDADFWMMSCR